MMYLFLYLYHHYPPFYYCFSGVISMGVGVGTSFFSSGVGAVGGIGTSFLSADFFASYELFASVLSDINTFGLSAIFLAFGVLLIGVASSMFIIGMSEARFSASGVLLTGVVSSMFTTCIVSASFIFMELVLYNFFVIHISC